MELLHVGSGKCRHEGMMNLTQTAMDISRRWPFKENSVDGIVSMQVLQQLYWRDLIVALREMYRVLKPGGVMRFGTLLVDDSEADYALGWENINLFSFDLLQRVLGQVGFKNIRRAEYQDSLIEEFKKVDNRPVGLGTSYLEMTK